MAEHIFHVMDDLNECYERRVAAYDAHAAAERWAEITFGDRDYNTDTTAKVTDANGVVTYWEIETRSEPVFYARPSKKVAPPALPTPEQTDLNADEVERG